MPLDSDSLLVNVILPVVEILNRLIDPGLQQDLLIVPTREASTSAGKSASNDKRKLNHFISSHRRVNDL